MRKQTSFEDVTLGVSSDVITKLVGREGQRHKYDKLPSIPLPRTIYEDIPESTEWFVWRNKESGIAELTLGVYEGRVIYKHAQYLDKDGKPRGVARTLPEYQIQNK